MRLGLGTVIGWRSRYGGAGGGGGSSYNLANIIATMRADATYGALLTSTANSYSPNGLELPAAPSGTLVDTPVASLAALRAAVASGQNTKRVTLAPGTYNEAGVADAVYVLGSDLEIVLTGCNIGTLTGQYGIRVHPQARRVRIIGGNLTNTGLNVAGRDIRLTGQTINGSGVFDANFGADRPSNQCIVGGHRILFERQTSTLADSTFFVEPSIECTFNATFNGAGQMTINSVDHNSVAVGHTIVGIGIGTGPGLLVTGFASGTGGAGSVVNLSGAGPTGTTNCWAKVQSTNCIAADCNFTVPTVTGVQGNLHENPCRINGATFSGTIDCRLWVDQKHSWRSHASYTEGIKSGNNFWIRCQSERGGLYGDEPGATGIFPATDNIIIDGRNGRPGDGLWRPSGMGNNLLSIPRLVGGNTLNPNVILLGFKSNSAPHEGTAGQGVLPTGTGSPGTGWIPDDLAEAVSLGDVYATYAAPPAWAFH